LKQADVVISGGGMVGLTLGLALAQGGLRTAIVDLVPASTILAPQFDGRVSALAYASVRMLTALGVWEALAPHAQPIREILVTDGQAGKPASPFSLHFDAQEVGAESSGPYRREPAYPRRAVPGGGTPAQSGTDRAGIGQKPHDRGGGAIARLQDGSEIAAPLVIAADGRESRLRSEMGINVVGWSYRRPASSPPSNMKSRTMVWPTNISCPQAPSPSCP
jgi:2-octaprenyl-6-methoxyphenol hydroxylase